MKSLLSLAIGAVLTVGATAASLNDRSYVAKYDDAIPYGVSAWSQSERVKKGIGRESRFTPYPKKATADLVSDVSVERGTEGDATDTPRTTSFYQAYDDKGWYIYIEAKEPLVEEMLGEVMDPFSPANREAYEVFFAPGMQNVTYYQIMINPYQERVRFFDYDVPHENFRTLSKDTKVESLPVAGGSGTFIFIPWYLLYERIPLEGGQWRFTTIRWMPYSKTGGVTWGGRVHETGRFGTVEFEKPTQKQREAIQRRALQYAWYKFLADSKRLAEHWQDHHIGDPAFHENYVAPEIARLTALGEKLGPPKEWTSTQIMEGYPHLKALMELPYTVAQLRENYLSDKRFNQ